MTNYVYITNPKFMKCIYEYKKYQFWIVYDGSCSEYTRPIEEEKSIRIGNYRLPTITLFITKSPMKLIDGVKSHDIMYLCDDIMEKVGIVLYERRKNLIGGGTFKSGTIDITSMNEEELQRGLQEEIENVIRDRKHMIDKTIEKENDNFKKCNKVISALEMIDCVGFNKSCDKYAE